MKRFAWLLPTVIAIAPLAMAQDFQEGDAPADAGVADDNSTTTIVITAPTPATQLEALAARAGSVIVRGYARIATLQAESNTAVRVHAIILRDETRNEAKKGVAIDVLGAVAGRVATAYVDDDEVDGLVKALDRLASIDRDAAPPFKEADAVYRTKSGMEIANVDDGNGGRIAYIRAVQYVPVSGRVLHAMARLRLGRLSELARTIETAAKRVRENGDLGQ